MLDFRRLKIGDRLIRTKGGIFSKHHAIYAGFHYNEYWIAENQINYGVRYIPLSQFLQEGTLERIEYNNFDQCSQERIINFINNKIGTNYSLINYNCEHFANEVLTGLSSSNQINNALKLSVGFLLIYALLDD